MSSPIELFGSYVGTAVGVVYQFIATLNNLAGGGDTFTKVLATLVILLLTVKLLKRAWALIALVFKLFVIALLVAAILRVYEVGFTAYAEQTEQLVANAYGFGVTLVETIKNLIVSFDSHLVNVASDAWQNFIRHHNL